MSTDLIETLELQASPLLLTSRLVTWGQLHETRFPCLYGVIKYLCYHCGRIIIRQPKQRATCKLTDQHVGWFTALRMSAVTAASFVSSTHPPVSQLMAGEEACGSDSTEKHKASIFAKCT